METRREVLLSGSDKYSENTQSIIMEIDIEDMNLREKEVLLQFLQQNTLKLIKQEVVYIINKQSIRCKQMLLASPCANNPNETHYVISSTDYFIAKGGFGSVYASPGVIKISNNHLTLKLKSRVVKHQIDSPIEKVQFEQQISPYYLHFKAPVSVENESWSVMARINGQDGCKFIAAFSIDIEYSKKTTKNFALFFNKALEVSTNASNSLQEIHALGIVHQDIKPENLIIDLNTLEVSLIDFGLSKKLTDPINNEGIIGSRYYRAPECECDPFKNTPESDIYSLGMTLFELWGGDVLEIADDDLDMENAIINERGNFLVNFGLKKEEKNQIRKIISTMCSSDPMKRPCLQQVTAEFELLWINRFIKTNPENKQEIQEIYHIATALRNKIANYSYQNLTIQNSGSLVKDILEVLNSLPDATNSLQIHVFKKILRVKAFKDFQDKESLINVLTQTLHDFVELDQLKKDNSYSRFFSVIQQLPASLDNMKFAKDKQLTKQIKIVERLQRNIVNVSKTETALPISNQKFAFNQTMQQTSDESEQEIKASVKNVRFEQHDDTQNSAEYKRRKLV